MNVVSNEQVLNVVVSNERGLKWFGRNCLYTKEITQEEMPIARGKMKDIKEIRKRLHQHMKKLQDGKKLYAISNRKSWRCLILFMGLFKCSKKWEPLAIHMLSTTNLKVITQIKKQKKILSNTWTKEQTVKT